MEVKNRRIINNLSLAFLGCPTEIIKVNKGENVQNKLFSFEKDDLIFCYPKSHNNNNYNNKNDGNENILKEKLLENKYGAKNLEEMKKDENTLNNISHLFPYIILEFIEVDYFLQF